MKADAAIEAVSDGRGGVRFPVLQSQAPLVLRRSHDEVYVVAAAGGPLGGDVLRLTITVGAGATLTVRSVAATVAQPSLPPAPSLMAITVVVGPGATFSWLPEPTVIADRAQHTVDMRVEAAADARVVLRDCLVLGRHGERGGAVTSNVSVDVGGTALLRQSIALDGADAVTAGPGVLAGARTLGTVLVVDPFWTDIAARPPATATSTFARLPLGGPGVLVTVLGSTTAQVVRELALGENELRQFQSPPRGLPLATRDTVVQ